MLKQIFFGAIMVSLPLCAVGDNDTEAETAGITHSVFEGEIIKENEDYAPDYVVGLHTRIPAIKSRYEENGQYYYNKYGENSFGTQEPLNTQLEMIVCENGEQSFQHAMQDMVSAAQQKAVEDSTTYSDHCLSGACIQKAGLTADSTSMPITKEIFDNVVTNVISTSNATTNARGRFCYDMNDTADKLDYRDPQAASETYCSRGDDLPIIIDPVSGFSCLLSLDIPLKVGNTRFLRQAQPNAPTVGQGYVGCYTDPATGNARAELIQNPQTCSLNNPGACTQSCKWANEVVCDSNDMPRWGGVDGKRCGALATTLFKGDAITVNASAQLSYSSIDGITYAGEATMSCAMVSGKAQWVISNASCGPQITINEN